MPFLVRLSRTTRKVVIQNLAFGVAFIILGVVFSALGYIPPVVAVLLHLAGSLAIVFNSARLVRFGEELDVHEDSDYDVLEGGNSDEYDTGPIGPAPATVGT